MQQAEEYDIAIVGGGPGGYVAAIRAAQLGATVALVEKNRLGGTCLNRGCIPTKALFRSMEAFKEAQRASDFGVKIEAIQLDFPQIMARKNRLVQTLVSGVERLMKGHGIEVHRGVGRLQSPRRVQVGEEQTISARKVVLATGSVSARIPIPGLDLPGVLTSDELLDVPEVPRSLAIIGGGVIGMEFAAIFSALGSKVTILEMLPGILPPVDEELAQRYAQLARRQGLTIHTSAKVKAVEAANDTLEVIYDLEAGEQRVAAEKVLVAVGRSPYTEGLGVEGVGLKMNRRAVAVDEHLQTNLEGVYAIGDVVGRTMLAHVASHEGEVAVENALGRQHAMDYRVVPNCIFSSPEIGAVGLTERQAKEMGIPYKVSRFPFTASARAQIGGEAAGLVKLVCEVGSGKVLGVHIMGPHATDLIAEGALALQLGATAQDLVDTIHAHPTLPEAMREAALDQFEGPIHFQRVGRAT